MGVLAGWLLRGFMTFNPAATTGDEAALATRSASRRIDVKPDRPRPEERPAKR
jgi:hypothetical protein